MAQTYRRSRIEKVVTLFQSMKESEERKLERFGTDIDPYIKGLFEGSVNSFDAVIEILSREFLQDDSEHNSKG